MTNEVKRKEFDRVNLVDRVGNVLILGTIFSLVGLTQVYHRTKKGFYDFFGIKNEIYSDGPFEVCSRKPMDLHKVNDSCPYD